MYVGAGDRAAVLACFDETAAPVFATLCQLTAGDSRLALDLLEDTFSYLDRMATSSRGLDVDQRWMIDAAHSMYAAQSPRAGRDEIEPVASLSAAQRVVVHLHDVERRPLVDIAVILSVAIAEVEQALAAGRMMLTPAGSNATIVDTFRRGEVWFDDVMRAQARARLGDRSIPSQSADDPVRASDEPARTMSRRTMVGATAAGSIAALVGIGIWVGSSDSGESASKGFDLPEGSDIPTTKATVAPTTTATTAPSTTAPGIVDTTTSTVILDDRTGAVVTSGTVVPPTGFIVDPVPEGLLAAGGNVDGDYLNGGQVGEWLQVWASSNATHTAGRWLAIFVREGFLDEPTIYGTNTHRIDLGGSPALLHTFASGILYATIALDDGLQIELHTYGFTRDDLSQLVGSMTFSSDHEPVLDAGELLDGLDLRVSRQAHHYDTIADLTSGDRYAYYSSPDGQQWVTINAGPQQEDDLFTIELLSAPSSDATAVQLAPTGTVEINGRQMWIGSFMEIGPTQFVQWHDRSYTITVTGSVAVSDLLLIAATTRLGTEDEWTAQRRTVPPSGDDGASVNVGDPNFVEFVEIGRNDTDARSHFDVSMSTAGLDQIGQLPITITVTAIRGDHLPDGASSGMGTLWTGIVPDPARPITVFLDTHATLLVGHFDSPGLATSMRVSVEGSPQYVPLVRLGDTLSYGAAYAFSQTADYAVALVDAHGILIQKFDV